MTPARSPPQLLKHHADNTGLPVVVDFFSQSCGPCRMIAPAFKRLAQEYEGRVVFAKAENTAPGVFAAAGVRSMPTFHFYFDGKRFGWQSTAGDVDTALGVMHRLRTLGIRAHFWI